MGSNQFAGVSDATLGTAFRALPNETEQKILQEVGLAQPPSGSSVVDSTKTATKPDVVDKTGAVVFGNHDALFSDQQSVKDLKSAVGTVFKGGFDLSNIGQELGSTDSTQQQKGVTDLQGTINNINNGSAEITKAISGQSSTLTSDLNAQNNLRDGQHDIQVFENPKLTEALKAAQSGDFKGAAAKVQEVDNHFKSDTAIDLDQGSRLLVSDLPPEQGPAGKDGAAGKDGTNGKDGLNGKDGTNGIDGLNGKDGINGKDGKDGATGPAGPQGPEGPQGPQGQTGPEGPQGPQGTPGTDTNLPTDCTPPTDCSQPTDNNPPLDPLQEALDWVAFLEQDLASRHHQGTKHEHHHATVSSIFSGLPGLSDIANSIPSPSDIFKSLPNPANILNSLPNPFDMLSGGNSNSSNPTDILSALPNPASILNSLPNPFDMLSGGGSGSSSMMGGLPTPGDLLNSASNTTNDVMNGVSSTTNDLLTGNVGGLIQDTTKTVGNIVHDTLGFLGL